MTDTLVQAQPEPYRGPKLGCAFCIYERSAPVTQPSRCGDDIPDAKFVVGTPNGPREVCQAHAFTGTWKTNGKTRGLSSGERERSGF